jgi:hypothetical protein
MTVFRDLIEIIEQRDVTFTIFVILTWNFFHSYTVDHFSTISTRMKNYLRFLIYVGFMAMLVNAKIMVVIMLFIFETTGCLSDLIEINSQSENARKNGFGSLTELIRRTEWNWSNQEKAVLNDILNTKSVWISGPGGCGKSFFVERFKICVRQSNTSDKFDIQDPCNIPRADLHLSCRQVNVNANTNQFYKGIIAIMISNTHNTYPKKWFTEHNWK